MNDRTLSTTPAPDATTALRYLQLAGCDIAAAHRWADDASHGLTGARRARTVELADKLADAMAHARRLAMIVEGDLRAGV